MHVATNCFFLSALVLLILPWTLHSECPPVYLFSGEEWTDELGNSVSGAGDVNNDGFDDLIVGVRLNDAGGYDAGQVNVYSGQSGDLLFTITGEAAYDIFGISVSGAGDVNSDGYDDLIVGAHLSDGGGPDAGRAYVYSGRDSTLLYTFTGEAPQDWFGFSVSGAGDVNNDGFDDLIVGAYGNDAVRFNGGRAYVYSGQNGVLLYSFTGEAQDDNFGRSVSNAGDVNSDGYDDLIVGAPSNGTGGSNAGRAYVYSGQTGTLLYTFTGEAVNDFFGNSISGAGDVNNDGFDDLVVGSSANDAGGNVAGRTYVYSGLSGGILYTFTGETAGERSGTSVSGAGDVNGDGFDDLIVGADYRFVDGDYAGQAYVYSGQSGTRLYTFTGEAAQDLFGGSVSGAGDVNNDGLDDLIVGAHDNNVGGLHAGRAYVYYGGPCGATIHVPADQPTIQAGIDSAIPGDTVLVADGTYTGTGNRDIDFGGRGIILKSENGPDVTIIDCQGSAADPHQGFNFHSAEETTAIVDGFTILNSYSPVAPPSESPVGSIKCDSSSSPTITNNIISGNDGAGISCNSYSAPLIKDNTIRGNNGSAILCTNFSSPVIRNNDISGNTADIGGGIQCHVFSKPLIEGNAISDNNAVSFGGGIYCFDFADPIIRNNDIFGNSANIGGGIQYSHSSNPLIDSNNIGNNHAFLSGGGVHGLGSSGRIWNNIIDRNSADSLGGGIHCVEANTTIFNNTFSANEAHWGGGLAISSYSLISVENCIFAFNNGGAAVWSQDEHGVLTLACSNVFGNVGGDWVGPIADQADGNGNFSADPLFCDTAMGDYGLSPFSPCLPQYNSCGSLIGALDLGCEIPYLCADANGDSLVTMDDVVFLQSYYFDCSTTPFPFLASDLNCDGSVDVADIIYLSLFLNGTGPEPCCM